MTVSIIIFNISLHNLYLHERLLKIYLYVYQTTIQKNHKYLMCTYTDFMLSNRVNTKLKKTIHVVECL